MVTTAVRDVEGGFDPAPPRFVARRAEHAAASAALDRAAGGSAQLVVVNGPSGAGRTSLCELIGDEAAARGFGVALGRCWPGAGAPPLWPWPSVLRELVDDHRIVRWDDDLGAADRFTLFRAIAASVDRATLRRPCLVILDDVQVADVSTLLLARFLVRSLARRRLGVVLSRRTVDEPQSGDVAAATFAELTREATVIDLPGIAGAEDGGGSSPLLVGDLPGPTRSTLGAAAVLGRATVWEIAALTGTSPAGVLGALEAATMAGATEISPTGVVAFTHEDVRTAVLAGLSVADQLDTHASAVAVRLGAGGRDAALRAATHAVAAAPRSAVDRRLAVDVCRLGARAARAGGGYERAAELLDAALDLSPGLLTGDALVEVQLERADAALACGRLDDSRHWFGVAAAGAADAVLAASAALGLGGVWVYEHRDECDRDRVLELQRAALGRLPDSEPVLRAGLQLRLAAEAAYDGGPLVDVTGALHALRALTGGRALAQGLSLAHHALLAPEHLDARRRLADELVAVASAASDGLLVLFGLMWRTVDRYHAADPTADRSLAELRERANAVGCRSIRFVADAMAVMQLIRAGRLDAAEVAAGECFELGLEVGDADAAAYYGAHLLTIRYFQGRDHEIADLAVETAVSPTVMHGEYSLRAAAAGVVARAGRRQEAATMLHALTARGLSAIPRSSTWLAAMAAVIDAAHELDDARAATEAYGLLAPYAELPVAPSLAVTCLGSVEHWLGRAAATFGELDRAVAHLERALRANQLLVNRPATAVSQADLAAVLARRSGPGDRERAVLLLGLAADEAAACSMPVRAATWTARRDELTCEPGDGATDAATASARLERVGGRWVLGVGDRRVPLPALVGVDHVARLVEHPGREVTAIELGGADPVLTGGSYAVLDRSAVHAIRQRVSAIDDEIARARRRGRANRVAELEDERARLEDEVRRGLGRGGRSREFVTPGERARSAVTKAIKRAVGAVAAVDPALGEHLGAALVTGARCCYRELPDTAVRWEVRRNDPPAGR